MKKARFDFSKDKIVFTDWLYVEAGRGNAKSNQGKRNQMMPYGVQLRCFRPQLSNKPILQADKPWEGAFIGSYISTISDPKDKKIKLYYEAYPSDQTTDRKTFFCIAESEDGRSFVKPNLGLVEWNNSTSNNIIFKPEMHPNKRGIHGAGVFIDKNPDCPESERYKMIYDSVGKDRSQGYAWGAVSADGLRWDMFDAPLVRTWADTQTIVRWLSEKRKYIGFFRSWHYNRRQIYYAESEDFRNWSDPIPVFTSDPSLPVDVDYYTNGFCPWPGTMNAYLMMPTNYRRTMDNLYVEMYGSRDLIHWHRFNGNPIIVPEQSTKLLRGGHYLGTGIVELDNNIWALPVGVPWYYHNEPRDPKGQTGQVRWARWRQDGFTGLVVDEKGEFWTQPNFFEGDKLRINAWTHPNGEIRVGIWDDFTKRALPGLSAAESNIISGNPEDKIWRTVGWKNDTDLSDFDDVCVRLHFKITRGVIHAFQFY